MQQNSQNRYQYAPAQQRYVQQPAKASKHRGTNLGKMLIKLIFSPLIVVIIGLVIFQDVRKALLLGLYLVTLLTALSLVTKILKLGLSAVTMNIIGFIKTSIDIVLGLVVTAIYWIIYIFVFGFNLSL